MSEPTRGTALAPITHARQVRVGPAQAFAAFTAGLGRWWDPRLTADPSTFRDARVEPRVGGSVGFLHDGGLAYDIGRVTSWRPGEQVAMDFWLALDSAHPTTLSVDFSADGGHTLVSLAHGGWTPENAHFRHKFTEWGLLLDRFAGYVEA